MRWPVIPTERIYDFSPPFCPRRTCAQHTRAHPRGFRFRRIGAYSTQRRRNIPRFQCLTCRRSFSRQSFATSYYLKRPELLTPVAAGLVAGSAHRQIARSVGCAASTVTRLSARLGRHCLLLLARALAELRGQLAEPLTLDHFETFEFTQDYPFGTAVAVGASSWFVYGMEPAPHRRTGTRSAVQQRRLDSRPARQRLGGYEGSCLRLLPVLLGLAADRRPLELWADGHPAYTRAVMRRGWAGRIRLRSFPNPPRGPRGSPRSLQARLRDRALYPVDLLSLLLRHSQAHHRRETIAFGRRLNALMERFFVAAIWRNFVKARSERRPKAGTPAMRVGLATSGWEWPRVLSRRLFHAREQVPEGWKRIYRRDWTTPVLKANTRHRLKRAW